AFRRHIQEAVYVRQFRRRLHASDFPDGLLALPVNQRPLGGGKTAPEQAFLKNPEGEISDDRGLDHFDVIPRRELMLIEWEGVERALLWHELVLHPGDQCEPELRQPLRVGP